MAHDALFECLEAFYEPQKRKNNLNRYRDAKSYRDERKGEGGGINFDRKKAASRVTQFLNEPVEIQDMNLSEERNR